MKHPAIHVTDHAVLRYLERVQGWDIEEVRAHIAKRVEPAVRCGASGIQIEGFSYKLSYRDAVVAVTTIMPVHHVFPGESDRVLVLDDGGLFDAGRLE